MLALNTPICNSAGHYVCYRHNSWMQDDWDTVYKSCAVSGITGSDCKLYRVCYICRWNDSVRKVCTIVVDGTVMTYIVFVQTVNLCFTSSTADWCVIWWIRVTIILYVWHMVLSLQSWQKAKSSTAWSRQFQKSTMENNELLIFGIRNHVTWCTSPDPQIHTIYTE